MNTYTRPRGILCVQTDQAGRDWFRNVFRDYQCTMAANAYEALRNVHARAFDAYILDYWLPDWNGVSLCRDIRKLDPHGPALFCSASVSEQLRHRALRAGASGFLCKPLEEAVVTDRMKQLLAVADAQSLAAKAKAETVIQALLKARVAALSSSPETLARDSVERGLERSARTRAFKTFLEFGGTRANFDAWWPQVFRSARANVGLA